MNFRGPSAAISFLALLGFSSVLYAQRATTPTLEEILERLQGNLKHYDTGVPSFFCDEHVVSQIEPDPRKQDTTTDSIFRLKRIVNPDHGVILVESREIKDINGKPTVSQDLKGPSLISGAFEGALAVVSLSQRACMKYTLERIHGNRPTEPYVIRFATALTPENSGDCLLQEKSSGRVFIDPASVQITRLELTTSHHTIVSGTWYATAVVGKRVLTVDYAPVVLGGESFWMPSTIASRDISGSGTYHATVWSYQASYRNYHRLEVKSRILPGGDALAQ